MVNKEYISPKEGMILRHLYLCDYQKNLFSIKSCSIEGFIQELKKINITPDYIRKVLRKAIAESALVFHKYEENKDCKWLYYVNRKGLLEMLKKDKNFQLDEKIMEERYIQIER